MLILGARIRTTYLTRIIKQEILALVTKFVVDKTYFRILCGACVWFPISYVTSVERFFDLSEKPSNIQTYYDLLS